MSTVVGLSPHPDDVELGCWGALMRHRRRGDRVIIVQMCLLTKLHDERREEARNAAKLISAETVSWSEGEDYLQANGWTCSLLDDLCLRQDVSRVYAPSPRDTNQDHIAAAHLAMQQARNGREVILYETPSTTPEFSPTMFVGMGMVDFANKESALRCHQSQLSRRTDLLNWLLVTSSYRAATGFPTSNIVKCAEAFEPFRLLEL